MFQPSRMGGLFGLPGQRPPYQTPGIGDGMEQHHNLPQQAEAPRKGGIFAQGGVGRSIAGHIGDALLQMNRMQPIYSEAVAAQRLMQQRQKLAEQQRQWGREDKQWEWDNKPATGEEYTYFEDNAGNRWRQHKGTGAVDQNPTFIDRTPKEFVHEGMRFSIPNPYLRGEGGGSADDAPTVEDGFAYTPGPGGRANPANWKPEGGAGSNASGGFLDAFRGGI
jgi:hypothetical protein